MYGRSSAGNLDRYDDAPPPPRSAAGGTERWDRARFESMRRGPPPPGGGDSGSSRGGRDGGGRDDYDHFHFQEHDKGPGFQRDVDFHEDRGPRHGPPVMERERFREDERFGQPARRSNNNLFEEPTPSEVANRALAPYRRQSVIDKDINIDIDIDRREQRPARAARPARPGYIRRQSSLDTFDRRPVPRYNEIERIERNEIHEYRLPPNVPIPLPVRERRRSPPRRFREEDEFEEVRYDDRSGRGREHEHEDYREVEVHKEKSRVRRSKSVAAKSTRSSSMSSFEEIHPPRANYGKKGKTRLPKRLVKKQAVVDLGYPFEEEDDFIVITRALEKDHIDEVIKISESYKEEKTTYVYEEKYEAPPPPPESVAPPPPPTIIHAPPPPASVYAPPPPASVYAPPPPASVYAPPPPVSVYAPSVRAPSPHHHHEEYIQVERSATVHGPATSFLPEHRQLVRHEERHDYRSERDIKDEIRQLEDERRMLKYERETDYEIIERRDPKREVIRVDKDRKGRRDRPNPKLIAAMMGTLT